MAECVGDGGESGERERESIEVSRPNRPPPARGRALAPSSLSLSLVPRTQAHTHIQTHTPLTPPWSSSPPASCPRRGGVRFLLVGGVGERRRPRAFFFFFAPAPACFVLPTPPTRPRHASRPQAPGDRPCPLLTLTRENATCLPPKKQNAQPSSPASSWTP